MIVSKKVFIGELKKFVKKGDTIQMNLNHVSRSGMLRHISFYVIKRNELINIDYYISNICDYRRAKGGSLKVSGCGMDMGFAVVYVLGRCLWPGDYKDKNDGGYSLKYQWIN